MRNVRNFFILVQCLSFLWAHSASACGFAHTGESSLTYPAELGDWSNQLGKHLGVGGCSLDYCVTEDGIPGGCQAVTEQHEDVTLVTCECEEPYLMNPERIIDLQQIYDSIDAGEAKNY